MTRRRAEERRERRDGADEEKEEVEGYIEEEEDDDDYEEFAQGVFADDDEEGVGILEDVERCRRVMSLTTFELGSRLDMNESIVKEGLEAMDRIAERLEKLETLYLTNENCCPMMSDRENFEIGDALESIKSLDWTNLLQACLSTASPSLRGNIYVKNVALRLLLAITEPSEVGSYSPVFLMVEQCISYHVLLSYAYGDAFLKDTKKSGGTPASLRKRTQQHDRVEDEIAAQVIQWWKEKPEEAKVLRTRATALLAAFVFVDKAAADYVMETHVEKGIHTSFPRVLLNRIRRELFPEYQQAVGSPTTSMEPPQSASGSRVGKSKHHRSGPKSRKSMTGKGGAAVSTGKKRQANEEAKKEMKEEPKQTMGRGIPFYNMYNTELRFATRVLGRLSTRNTGVLRPILQENGLKIMMQLLTYGHDDITLAFETLLLMANLSVYKKFANEFINRGCLNMVFELARTTTSPAFLYATITYCLSCLAAAAVDRISQLPFALLRQLNKYMVRMITFHQDLTRINAMMYWSEALKCPINLRMFDGMDGPRCLLNVLARPMAPTASLKVEHVVQRVLNTLNTYMRAHVGMAANLVQNEVIAQSKVASLKQGNKQAMTQQQHMNSRGPRFRSDSVGSLSSIGSSASRSTMRTRHLPEDKPMEIDAVAHENDLNLLQTHRDVAMRILTRTKWKPVEVLLGYRVTEQDDGDSNESKPEQKIPTTAAAATSPVPPKSSELAQPLTRSGSQLSAVGGVEDVTHSSHGPEQVPALVMLLQVVHWTAEMEVPRSYFAESTMYALQILRVLTLLPHTYKLVCELSLPANFSPLVGDPASSWLRAEEDTEDEETVQGITVLLGVGLGTFEGRDALMIVSALQVICNCVSPSMGDDRSQRHVRRLARHNNALMTLLALLRYNETPRHADWIRYLACVALHGLANDHHVAQVLETLNITQALTKIARSEPILVENKRIHKKLKKEALKLIEHISDACKTSDSKAIIGDVADATNKRLMRNAIVERTQISFDSRELLGLIQDHLKDRGFKQAAEALREEMQEWMTKTTESSHGSLRKKPTRSSNNVSFWPTHYLKGVNAPRRRFGFIKARAVSDVKVAKKQDVVNPATAPSSVWPGPRKVKNDGFHTPLPTRKRTLEDIGSALSSSGNSTAKRRRYSGGASSSHGLVPSGGQGSSSGAGEQMRILHTSSGPCTGLERIVQDYLREQHRKCLDPVTIIPPFSLTGKPHECVAETSRGTEEAPANILKRLMIREITGNKHGGLGGLVQDVRLLHGRSKCVRTFKNITRNEDIVENEPIEDSEANESYTAVTFLHHSSDYEDLLLGTSAGDLVIRNTHTCQTFAKWKVHEKPIRSVTVTPDGSRVLTCASDVGTVSLSKFPASVVREYGAVEDDNMFERQYTYNTRRRNRQEDELLTLWQDTNIADVELDRSGRSVVATLLNPENDGHEHAAIVYDLSTGQEVVKLVDSKLSSRYWWHRACFTPHGSSMVLHDGLLWDVRSRKVVHKFDKLSECGRSTFKPDGTQVVIDASVWDLRTYKLFATCPAFEAAVVTFDANSTVAYSYHPELGQTEEDKELSSYNVIDVSDYSTITTNELDPYTIQGLALNQSGQKLAIIMDRSSIDEEEWPVRQRMCKLFEIGRSWNLEADLNPDEEDDEDSSTDDSSSDGEDDDHGDDSDSMGGDPGAMHRAAMADYDDEVEEDYSDGSASYYFLGDEDGGY